jgi:hypothetical protein
MNILKDTIKPNEQIHDIDFTISYDVFTLPDYKENLDKVLKELNAVPTHFGWGGMYRTATCYAYLIPVPGYRVEVLERSDDTFGYAQNIKVYNNKGEEAYISPWHSGQVAKIYSYLG